MTVGLKRQREKGTTNEETVHNLRNRTVIQDKNVNKDKRQPRSTRLKGELNGSREEKEKEVVVAYEKPLSLSSTDLNHSEKTKSNGNTMKIDEKKDENNAEDDDDNNDDDDDLGVDEDDEFNFDADNEELTDHLQKHINQRVDQDDDDDSDLYNSKTNLSRKSENGIHSIDRESSDDKKEAEEEDHDDDNDPRHKDIKFEKESHAGRSFESTMALLLTQKVKDEHRPPILAAAPKVDLESDPTFVKSKQSRLKRIEKISWKNRANVMPQFNEIEKKYIRIATKGVSQQQKAMRLAAQPITEQNKAKSKNKSMDEFEEHMQDVTAGNSKNSQIKKEDKESTGWSVLKEDYLLGSKLTDWDKQSDSDDEEEVAIEDGEEEEEEEREYA